MRLKRISAFLLSLCLVLSFGTFSVIAAESNPVKIYIENTVSGNQNEEITVPVIIDNNTGIMGYKISVSYDYEDLEIISVENGFSTSSNFNDSITENNGSFDVVWNSTENVTENGCLFNIKFKVLTDQDKISEISLDYSQEDTFDESFKDVLFSCNNGFVILNGSQHNFSSRVVDPTCTEQGYTVYECSDCEYIFITDYVDALGHKPIADEAEKATCTAEGKTEGSHCEVCGFVFTKQDTIAKLEHKSDKGTITKKATYTQTGVKTYRCTVCNTVIKTEKIAKLSKKKNTLKASGKTVTVKYNSLKNKNQTIEKKKAFSISKAKGKVKFTKKSGNAKVTVSSAGKVTVKKGLKKGIYEIKVKVTAAGNSTYKAGNKIINVTIKVK